MLVAVATVTVAMLVAGTAAVGPVAVVLAVAAVGFSADIFNLRPRFNLLLLLAFVEPALPPVAGVPVPELLSGVNGDWADSL